MTKSLLIAAVVALAALPAMAHGRHAPAPQQARAASYQVERSQEAAIERGLRTGQLTRAEANSLRRDQAQIDRMQAQARRDGGGA